MANQSRDLASALFVPDGDYYQCRLCPIRRKQTPGTGYTNLIDHLKRCHEDTYMEEFRAIIRREGSLDCYVKVDAFASNVFGWLDWTIMENRELGMCEKPKTRKYSSLQPLCVKTMKKYMFGVEDVVRERIKRALVDQQVGFLIDAWTEDGTHFVAVIAVTPTDKYLLCFSTLENEADMSSDAMIELLDDVLDTYRIDLGQLCFIVCDHASVNVAISTKTGVPMIGCASHRLNLAVQALMEPHTEILNKVHQLMSKLNTIKNRHFLREMEALMPVLRNATRWSSTFAMVDRYLRLADKIDALDDRLADYIPTARETVKLKSLHEDLKKLESVNKKLQTEYGISLRDTRLLFDHVIEHFPSTSNYLSATAHVVKFPHFESGIVKIVAGEHNRLTRDERLAVAKLTRVETPVAVAADKPLSFAETALSKGRAKATTPTNKLDWIPATSNDVERLFSRAGIVYTRLRRAMNPMTLETMLFLQYNRKLWDGATVAEAIETRKNKKARVV